MTVRPIDVLQVADPELRRVQDRVVTAYNEVARLPIMAGRLLPELVVLDTGVTVISHGLGRKPEGWFLVSPKGDARVWEDPGYAGYDRRYHLLLRASAALITSVWVF